MDRSMAAIICVDRLMHAAFVQAFIGVLLVSCCKIYHINLARLPSKKYCKANGARALLVLVKVHTRVEWNKGPKAREREYFYKQKKNQRVRSYKCNHCIRSLNVYFNRTLIDFLPLLNRFGELLLHCRIWAMLDLRCSVAIMVTIRSPPRVHLRAVRINQQLFRTNLAPSAWWSFTGIFFF